jgi:DNA-binding transcriptional MerR regulator
MDYSIGEVAKMIGVSQLTIRAWEQKGLIPLPKRTTLNHRRYTDDDVKTIKSYIATRDTVNHSRNKE